MFVLDTIIRFCTDGLVESYTACYAYAIPSMHIQSSENLPLTDSSFTAECHVVQESLSICSLSEYW